MCSVAALLAACGTSPPASVASGECKVFREEIAGVCGLTRADQDVIDENAEAGVAACRWQRPLPKTPTCEEIRAEIAELRARAAGTVPVPKAPPKKKGVVQRFREKVKL